MAGKKLSEKAKLERLNNQFTNELQTGRMFQHVKRSTRIGKALAEVEKSLVGHVGGNPSTTQEHIIKETCFLIVVVHSLQSHYLKKALADKKPVPKRVLVEYPEFKPEPQKKYNKMATKPHHTYNRVYSLIRNIAKQEGKLKEISWFKKFYYDKVEAKDKDIIAMKKKLYPFVTKMDKKKVLDIIKKYNSRLYDSLQKEGAAKKDTKKVAKRSIPRWVISKVSKEGN